MSNWIPTAHRRHHAATAALAAALPEISVPMIDSPSLAPGWNILHTSFYGHQDVAYPTDPTIIKAIREFCPDVVPITIKTVAQYCNYGENTSPVMLVRHGLARSIEDPKLPIHDRKFFNFLHPPTPACGLRIPGRTADASQPNYVEVNWYDKAIRVHGWDLPGGFLPCDWEFYYACRRGYADKLPGQDLARALIDPEKERRLRREIQRNQDWQYVKKDVDAQIKKAFDNASDLEIMESFMGPSTQSQLR
jgi:hypothetical protein